MTTISSHLKGREKRGRRATSSTWRIDGERRQKIAARPASISSDSKSPPHV